MGLRFINSFYSGYVDLVLPYKWCGFISGVILNVNCTHDGTIYLALTLSQLVAKIMAAKIIGYNFDGGIYYGWTHKRSVFYWRKHASTFTGCAYSKDHTQDSFSFHEFGFWVDAANKIWELLGIVDSYTLWNRISTVIVVDNMLWHVGCPVFSIWGMNLWIDLRLRILYWVFFIALLPKDDHLNNKITIFTSRDDQQFAKQKPKEK